MPVGFTLIEVGKIEQRSLAEVRTDQLQADRQAGREAAGDRKARQSREVDCDRIDVVQVHLHRIIDFLAQPEGRRRCRRSGNDVHFGETAPEIISDQLPRLLRLEVVGIVVACREHIGTGQDPAFDLGTKTVTAGFLVELLKRLRTFMAVTEAHPVETRQVRRTLGGCDDVIGGHRQCQARQRDFHQLRTQPLVNAQRFAHRGGRSRLEAGIEEFLRQADALAGDRTAELCRIVRHRQVGGGRVARIETRHRAQQQRRIFGAQRQHASLIEARGKGHHAVTGYPAIGRLQAGDPGERRRLADRTAGIGTRCGRDQSRRDRSRGAA